MLKNPLLGRQEGNGKKNVYIALCDATFIQLISLFTTAERESFFFSPFFVHCEFQIENLRLDSFQPDLGYVVYLRPFYISISASFSTSAYMSCTFLQVFLVRNSLQREADHGVALFFFFFYLNIKSCLMWSIDSCVSYRLYVRVMLVFIKEMYRRVTGVCSTRSLLVHDKYMHIRTSNLFVMNI